MELLLLYKAVVAVVWFSSIFIAERYFRAAFYPTQFTSTRKRKRLLSNMSISVINMVLSPLLIIPLTLFIGAKFTSWRPEWMNAPAFFLLDILLLDAFLYFWHRLNHQLPILWRFHEVHHLDEFLDSTTALRFHFGEVFLSSIARALFVVSLGISIESVIIFEICILIFSVFNHSNLRLPNKLESALSKVVVTPSIHWIHHHAKRVDTDANYGTIFSFWDRLFKTLSHNKRELSMPIGVEGLKELSLISLLLKPLKP